MNYNPNYHVGEDADVEMNDENHRIIAKCIEELKSPEFVMEPRVFEVLQTYLRAGGNPSDVGKYLAQGYNAIAQSANYLAEWLLMTDSDDRQTAFNRMQSTVEQCLQNLIIKHFDPKKADAMFLDETTTGTPEWLSGSIHYLMWRNLIYKLSEDYPECLLLTFTIKLISDAGFHKEITSISTASQQLEVFTRILKTSINSFIDQGQEKLNDQLMEFVKLVCHGEHTYIFSQALLHLLSLEPKVGSNIKRLSQEICNYAQKHGHDSTPITIALMGASSHPRVASALSAMLAKNALNPADITILYKAYQVNDSSPPVDFLRSPQLLDLLLDALFKPGSKLHTEHRPKYVYLLAYATSVVETYKKAANYQAYNNVAMRKTVNREELKPTIAAVEKLSAICAERKGSSEILPELNAIYQMIPRFQVVAYGIVHWVRYVVSETSFFKLNTEQTPLHLALLDEVTACHQTLHAKVLDLYIHIFESQHDELEVLAQLELKKMILDRMVHLLSKGCVEPVLNYIRQCWQKGDTDMSLIRYFVTEVLDMIAPPYSEEFVTLFLPLVECEELTGNIKSETDQSLVNGFIEICKANKE